MEKEEPYTYSLVRVFPFTIVIKSVTDCLRVQYNNPTKEVFRQRVERPFRVDITAYAPPLKGIGII